MAEPLEASVLMPSYDDGLGLDFGADGCAQAVDLSQQIVHTLPGEGWDASEDGTGRGRPIVVCGIRRRRKSSQTFVLVVRYLTPIECERLQGIPDNYTLIAWRKGFAADGPRYKAIGNGMAVPCVAWVVKRLNLALTMRLRSP